VATKVRKKDLIPGTGAQASRGDTVCVDIEAFLPKGDCVLSERRFEFKLGARRAVAGLEYGVPGMRVGGTREIRVPPHLAYGARGTSTIPPNAALRFVVNLVEVVKSSR
jgi:FKBP-type peptidyl-prolyl cis-trans isomerase